MQAHVIALGSATSVNYIEALINDVVNSNNNFKDIVNDYIDLLISIVDSIEEYPKLSSNVLSFFKGMAKVLSAFSINIYEQLIQHFNDDWSGSLTVEEGNAILSLYEVINDEAVIMDDLFIDVNSQLGYFDDNINYAGFNRYVKIFEPSDLTDNRAVNNLPAVVHNMETMNDTYTDFISNDIICGSSYECASIFELENVAGEFVGEKSFVFETKYSGLRKIIVNCNYSIYEKLGKEVEIDCNDNVYLEENKSYYIVLRSNSYINYQLKLDVNSIFNGSYELAPNSQNIFKLQANSIGFYDLNSSLLNIKFLDLDNNEIFYVYYNGNNLYVVVKNDCNYKVNVMLSLSTPNKILSENVSYNCQKNTIVMVESKDICMLYELSISKSSSVKILNSQNKKINYNIINSDKKKYIFSISKNETFYIVFGDNTTTILTGINDNLAWYINNKEIYENIINVYQNYSYNIVMKLKVDNEVVDIDCNYLLVDANNYFEIIEDNVYVNENAKLSSSASYCHIDFPTRAISIVVVPTNRMTTIVYNDERIRIKFYKKLGKNDNLSMLNFTIKYGNNQQIINCNMNINNLDYYYYFSDDLMKKMTTKCTFVFGYVIINGHMYDASFFDVKEIDFNGLYSCGSGTSIDPYIISSERNLKNINENKNSYFKLNANISLSDGWKPFYFRGEINGDGHRINYLIFDSINNGNVGLFSENFGTVKNLEINMASINISKCDKISITFGFIAGVNFGTIQNIIIKNSKIDAQKIGTSVGFISGKNNGNIYDCISESNILLASDEAGGIVGNNSGNINNCFVNSINITYTTEYSDNVYSNGNVGGVCGSNYGSIINCNSSGNFVWNENDNSIYIYPGLGKIIGFNSGSYFQCSSQIVVNIHYYWFIWYNQSGRCFKIDNGNVGYEP